MLAGFSIIGLCLMPYLLADTSPIPLFPTSPQEKFFFDVFGLIFACWLLCWVSALNEWKQMARAAQWLGIILLCSDEAVLVIVWRDLLHQEQMPIGLWLSPLILQCYLVGCFLGFFTLPGLTKAGNRTLTGLATLLILLPWLMASNLVRSGAEYLHGLVF